MGWVETSPMGRLSLHGCSGERFVPGWHGQAPLARADGEFVVENVYLFLLHVKLCKAKPNNNRFALKKEKKLWLT